MPTMADELNLDALYCLFKGEWGTRKSTSALSFPTPQEWFSWDRKMRAMLIPMKNWGINPTDIIFNDYSDWDTPLRRLEQLQANVGKAKTIIIDTITSCADASLKQVKYSKAGQTKKAGGEAVRRIGNILVNDVEDYKAEESALNDLQSITKDIHEHFHVNVVLIAHVVRTEQKTLDGKSNVSRSIVTAGKKIAAKIPGYCDEIYHFNLEENVDASKEANYAILTTHTGDDYARTSLPLPRKILFNNEPLYKYLKEAITIQKQGLTK